MNIGNAIRYLRKEKGWTQQELADFACTSKGNISNLENGHQGYSPALLDSFANAFDCAISNIFLLAENLDKLKSDNVDDLQDLPIDVLFSRLPLDIQKNVKDLLINMVQSYK